jgi:hypothetical protein
MYENDEGNLEFDVRFEEELKHKKEKDELEVGINLFLIFIMENTKQYLYIIMTI